MKNFFYLLSILLIRAYALLSLSIEEKPMVIISCGYNNKEYYRENLDSTLNQNYTNYRIIYVDDASPDDTGNLVETYLKEHDTLKKVTLIKNKQRIGLMANITQAVYQCDDDEIIVMVEADDCLAHLDVLSRINQEYQDSNIWITYGNFKGAHWDSIEGGSRQIPQEVINNNDFRNHLIQQFDSSHLRSFYAWLYKKIKLEDLLLDDLFWLCDSDLMKMVPMLEMAGNHSRFIPDILYHWNNENPLNEFKGDNHAATKKINNIYEKSIASLKTRPKYTPLLERPIKANRTKLNNEKPLVIISCGYKHKDFIERNLESTLNQNYTNYRIIYVDDASPDGSGDVAEQFIKQNDSNNRVTLIRNTIRLGLCANLYQAINQCDNHEIVVMVEADDWLPHPQILSEINKIYQSDAVWLTYGSFTDTLGNSSGKPRHIWEIPQKVVETNTFREYGFISGHLRTFYAELFKKIKLEHLLFNDKFFPVISDAVKMFPMLDMAGIHIYFVEDIMYIWNVENPINEFKTKDYKDLVEVCFQSLLNHEKYKPLDSLSWHQAAT